MKYSCSELMTTGAGHLSSQVGNSVASFSMKGKTWDVWKVGKVWGLFGRLSITVEMLGDASVIIYRPSYRGMNFATLFSSLALYSRCRWSIDNMTWPPFSKGKSSVQCSFTISDCEILARSILSCASFTSNASCWITSEAWISLSELSSLAMSGGIMRGLRPIRNWKGVKPVDALTVFMMLKRTHGKVRCQPV